MPTTASTLYRDSFNFFRNQWLPIFLLAVLIAFITTALQQVLLPDPEQLANLMKIEGDLTRGSRVHFDVLQQISPEDQRQIMKTSISMLFVMLLGEVLLMGGALTLLRLASQGEAVSALRSITLSLTLLPRLLALILIGTFLINLGLLVFIVPGVLLTLGLSLAPVILATEKIGVLASFRTSIKLAFKQARLIIPTLILWIIARVVLAQLLNRIGVSLPPLAFSILKITLDNLISIYVLIYLFRLYMVLRDQTAKIVSE